MLIACSHSQIFVAENLRDGVNVGAAHAHPTRGSVSQIMEFEIRDAHISAGPRKGLSNVVAHHLTFVENSISRFCAFTIHGAKRLLRELIQVDDSVFPFFV
jgi:hypothetical protein